MLFGHYMRSEVNGQPIKQLNYSSYLFATNVRTAIPLIRFSNFISTSVLEVVYNWHLKRKIE